MSNSKITKEAALDYHRDMWNWISQQYEQGRTENVQVLQIEFGEKTHTGIINACCYYDFFEYQENDEVKRPCSRCPIRWGTENYASNSFCNYNAPFMFGDNTKGLILQIETALKLTCYNVASNLAKKIAYLPENMNDNYQNKDVDEDREDIRW